MEKYQRFTKNIKVNLNKSVQQNATYLKQQSEVHKQDLINHYGLNAKEDIDRILQLEPSVDTINAIKAITKTYETQIKFAKTMHINNVKCIEKYVKNAVNVE